MALPSVVNCLTASKVERATHTHSLYTQRMYTCKKFRYLLSVPMSFTVIAISLDYTKHLDGKRFATDADVKQAVTSWLQTLDTMGDKCLNENGD